jgi:hypothetical protein
VQGLDWYAVMMRGTRVDRHGVRNKPAIQAQRRLSQRGVYHIAMRLNRP